jgi:hypothetical protein
MLRKRSRNGTHLVFRTLSKDFRRVPLEGDVALLPGGNEYAHNGGNGEKLYYHLKPSFLLHGYRVSPGTSGAAVIDQDTDCVVGIIAAADPEGSGPFGRSIAIPLTNAGEWPPLRDALNASARQVPRFGEAVNGAGAQALARAQRRAVVEGLMSSEDRKRFRVRIGINEFLEDFVHSDALLMPVTGESGSGKTFVMIGMALRVRHALLLRSISVDSNDRSTRPQVKRALEDDESGTPRLSQWIHDLIPRPSPEALARAARVSGKPLVLVLDDINSRGEARISADWIARTWMPTTLEWLKTNGAKLIISCRTEAWRLLLPPTLDRFVFPLPLAEGHAQRTFGVRRDPAGGIRVGDFTDQELPEMLQAYGIGPNAVDTNDARHPFFLRLALETGQASASRLTLIERAIKNRMLEVARLNEQYIVTVEDVPRLVTRLAGEMLANDDETVPQAAAELLGSPPLLKGLVSEGILESTRAGIRFRFDQYADAERSRFLVPPLDSSVLDRELPDLSRPAIRGALAFAVERMLGASRAFDLTGYRKISDSDAPLILRIQLLFEFARLHQDGWMSQWRRKDWASWDEHSYRPSFVAGAKNPYDDDQAGAFWKALQQLANEDAQAVRGALLRRLDDDRPIIGGTNREASLATLAGGCLTILREPDLEGLCSALASSSLPIAWTCSLCWRLNNPDRFSSGP